MQITPVVCLTWPAAPGALGCVRPSPPPPSQTPLDHLHRAVGQIGPPWHLLFPPPKGKWSPCTAPDEGRAPAAVLSSPPRPGFRRTTLPTSPHLLFPSDDRCAALCGCFRSFVWSAVWCLSMPRCLFFFITDYLNCVELIIHDKRGAIRITVNTFFFFSWIGLYPPL